MNHLFKAFTLIAIVLFADSFKLSNKADARFKSEGYFTAKIDGKLFDSRSQDRYTAEVTTTEAGKKNADIMFFGNDYFDRSGNLCQESLELKYAFSGLTASSIADQKIVFQFDNQKFLSVPGQTKINVTKMELSADGSNYLVSAEFQGKMVKWAAPGQDQPIVTVKGRMENIQVSIPESLKPTSKVIM